jgi:heavy metal sensor kinase
MHSIRLSLTIYFLVLLVATLGGASWFVLETAGQTLQDKRTTTSDMVRARYEEKSRQERDKFDKSLLDQARELARLAQFQFRADLFRFRSYNQLGLLTAGLAPSGPAAVPLWLLASQGGPGGIVSFELFRNGNTEIRLPQNDLLDHSEGWVAEYYQINASWGPSFHSKALGDRKFHADQMAFATEDGLPDDTVLDPDLPVRRMTLKVSMFRFGPPPGPVEPGVRPLESTELRRRGRPRPEFPNRMTLLVQVATNPRPRDAALQKLAASCDEELEEIDRATESSLSGLRNRLLAVATVAFLVGLTGCLGIVRVGLAPLRRLSDAVSRVSAKDFRLPYTGPRPPKELQPIVARFRETLDLLKRAFAREKQATADISHELRTPLAALLTTTEMALRRPRSVEEYQEVLHDCQASSRQMSRAVERLLALARLDAGADTLRLQAVDAAALAQQCMSVVRPLAEARGVKLAVHVEGQQVPQLTTDPDKFSEVLTNLLHNAIQYNRPGGDIDVRLGRQNGHFELAVKDTGVGIAPEARSHLFERFWRADPSRGEDGLHAGLGLAIVKGYVDLMGGTISVESTEGQGSTFRVQLPV